jgi:hypothetical protein
MKDKKVLVVNSSPEELAAMVSTIAYNKPVIQEFLETLGPQDTITFCAWFMGMLEIQHPDMTRVFDDARKAGKELAEVLLAAYRHETNAGDIPGTLVVVYPPEPGNQSNLFGPNHSQQVN